jgi:hypothetical protein
VLSGAPAAPTNLTATAAITSIALSWTASSGATSYKIYRGTSSGTEVLIKSGNVGTSYTDSGQDSAITINGAITYYYKVSAVNAAGESSLSSEVSAMPGPQNISGLQDWLSRYGHRYKTVDTSTPATTNGDWIYHHDVPTGSGVSITHVNSGSAGLRPTLATASVGTADSDAFNGSNQYYTTSLALTGAATYALRFKLTSTPGASTIYCVLAISNGTNKTTEFLLMNFAGYQNLTLINDCPTGVNGVGCNPTLDTSAHTLIWTYNGGAVDSTGSYTIRLDGVAQTVVANSLLNSPAGTSTLGVRTNLTNYAPVDLADLIVYNSVLSTPNQQALETLLSS